MVTDHGTYDIVHWVLYKIPGTVTSLEEGCEQFTQGKNDFGAEGYGGPMPPNGHGEHKYYFWILALKDGSELDSGLSMGELLAQIEPNLVGMNRLIGCYARD